MELIDYGGYGCIFSPELECSNNNKLRINSKTQKYIGKLQKSEDAIYEYKIMNKLLNAIKNTIPNYKNYFVLDDVHVCNTKLSRTQLIKKYENCPIIKKKKSIKQLIIPYMGDNLHTFLENNIQVFDNTFIKYNNKLIELYVKAIIPMNKLGFYHNDLKLSNILVLDNYYRIIDFGLMNYITYKYFSYNNPFNSVVLSDSFIDYYKTNKSNYTNIELIRNHLFNIELYKQGHYIDIIEPTLQLMSQDIITKDTANIHPLLFNYYVKCISTESSYDTVVSQKKKIFVHNLDTIGFLSIYSYLYLIYFQKNKYTTEPLLLSKIKKIYLSYMFTQDNISYTDFIKDIAKLNLCF